MISDLITSGAMHSLKSVFQKKKERNVIIDPFSCLVKLSLIRYLEEGTKVSIYQNRLNFNAPSYMQGIIRFMYGDNREDLHNILLPIQKCVEWFWNEKNPDITYMFNNAVLGLKFLKNSYSTYATIQHTLDYYILILMQKNTDIMARMGINNIDIERLTNAILDNGTTYLEQHQPTQLTQSTQSTQPTDKAIDKVVDGNRKNKEDNDKSKDKKNKQNTDNKNNLSINNNNNTNTNTIKNEENDNSSYESNSVNTNIQYRDIHKFLFELWNIREMNIVINLYKEMETKTPGSERNYIYNNIMQYCEMKENKLYKYIEQNSSVL